MCAEGVSIGLGDAIDAQIIVANMGTLELRTGHLKEAEVLLKSSVERERSLAGDSAAVERFRVENRIDARKFHRSVVLQM